MNESIKQNQTEANICEDDPAPIPEAAADEVQEQVQRPDLEALAKKPEDLGIHPAATLQPPMTAEEYSALREDIRRNGLREPIEVLENGDILDGVHRRNACVETDTPVRLKLFEGVDPESHVLSKHTRRNLSKGQLAVMAHRLSTRKNANMTQMEAAMRVGVSPRYAQIVARIQRELGHEVLDQIFTGEKSLNEVANRLQRRIERPDLRIRDHVPDHFPPPGSANLRNGASGQHPPANTSPERIRKFADLDVDPSQRAKSTADSDELLDPVGAPEPATLAADIPRHWTEQGDLVIREFEKLVDAVQQLNGKERQNPRRTEIANKIVRLNNRLLDD